MKTTILFVDLDGTLINTESGNTFPNGIWDMKFNIKCLDAIKNVHPTFVFIVTNQGGISSGFVEEDSFEIKLKYVTKVIEDYCSCMCEAVYCASNDKTDPRRKPNVGMFEEILNKYFTQIDEIKSMCTMIGDASGKEGQFSDSDKVSAENFGIDYIDVDDFIEEVLNKEHED